MDRPVTLLAALLATVVGVIGFVGGAGFAGLTGSTGAAPAPVRHDRVRLLDASPAHVAVIGDSYTAGSDEGGHGADAWTARAWQQIAGRGRSGSVALDVAAEGRAGYAVRGNRGSTFGELATRVVRPDDVLVVFFGSRNDRDIEPSELARMAADAFTLARRSCRSARLMVIGPPWPTVDVPEAVLRIRDILGVEARMAGGEFIDPIADRWFMDHPELIGADGVHPTDAGHAYMAAKIAPLIKSRLPRTD